MRREDNDREKWIARKGVSGFVFDYDGMFAYGCGL